MTDSFDSQAKKQSIFVSESISEKIDLSFVKSLSSDEITIGKNVLPVELFSLKKEEGVFYLEVFIDIFDANDFIGCKVCKINIEGQTYACNMVSMKYKTEVPGKGLLLVSLTGT